MERRGGRGHREGVRLTSDSWGRISALIGGDERGEIRFVERSNTPVNWKKPVEKNSKKIGKKLGFK